MRVKGRNFGGVNRGGKDNGETVQEVARRTNRCKTLRKIDQKSVEGRGVSQSSLTVGIGEEA